MPEYQAYCVDDDGNSISMTPNRHRWTFWCFNAVARLRILRHLRESILSHAPLPTKNNPCPFEPTGAVQVDDRWNAQRHGDPPSTLSTIEALGAARLNIIFLVETICPDYPQLLREFHKNVRQDSLLD